MTARPTVAPTWGGTQVEPSGGQKSAGFAPGDRPPAQWFNWLLDNFADWINYLDTEKLQNVIQATASIAILASTSDSQDHPGNATNIWKPALDFSIADGTRWRMFTGDGPNGSFAFTTNAAWNPASAGQSWSKDDTSKISRLLLVTPAGELQWLGRAAGAGTWTTWGDPATVGISGNLAADNVDVNGNLNVDGSAGIDGNVTAAGLSVANDVVAGDNMIAGDEFQYTSPAAVTKNVNINTASGALFLSSEGESILLAPAGTTTIAIHVPHGCPVGNVRVAIDTTGGTTDYTLKLKRKHTINYGSATHTYATLDTATGSGVGTGTVTLTPGITANKDEEVTLYILCNNASVGSLIVTAVDVTFTNNGPSNL